jgi:hypothetical protein
MMAIEVADEPGREHVVKPLYCCLDFLVLLAETAADE